jgi:hypothetical protein
MLFGGALYQATIADINESANQVSSINREARIYSCSHPLRTPSGTAHNQPPSDPYKWRKPLRALRMLWR